MNSYSNFIVLYVMIVWIAGYSQLEARTLVACPRRNMYIQTRKDGSQRCVPCTSCPKGTQKKRCLLWLNSECEICKVGTFNPKSGGRCKQCTKCQPGEFIQRPCSPKEDALCLPCPEGKFSSTENTYECTSCTNCRLYEVLLNNCNSTHDYGCGECKQEYFRESATGGCLPCSKCYGETAVVVPECYRKNGGYSDKNCLPSDRIWLTLQTEQSTVHQHRDKFDEDYLSPMLLGFLFVTLFSTIIVVGGFVCIHSSRRTQSLIRQARDKGRHSTKRKTRVNEAYQDQKKPSKLYTLFKKSWKAVRRYVFKAGKHSMTNEFDLDRSSFNGSFIKDKALTVMELQLNDGMNEHDIEKSDKTHITTTQDDKTARSLEVVTQSEKSSATSLYDNINEKQAPKRETDCLVESGECVTNKGTQGTSRSDDLLVEFATTVMTDTDVADVPSLTRPQTPQSTPHRKRSRNTCRGTTNTMFSNPKYFVLPMYNTF